MASKPIHSLRLRVVRLLAIALIIFGVEGLIAYHRPELGLHLLFATCFALLLSFAPFSVLRKIGQIPFLSPNWVSIWRSLIGLIAFPIFFLADKTGGLNFQISFFGASEQVSFQQLVGLSLVAISLALDRTDGRMAVALADIRSETEKKIGTWLDPLMDKVTFLGAFVYLWFFQGYFNATVLIFLFIPEVISTLIRPPFIDSERSGALLNRFLPWLKTSRATAVGKLKVILQFSVLLLCLPEHLYQFRLPSYASPTTLLWISALFSVLSVLSRLRLHKQLDENIDHITKEVFDHEDLN